MSRTPARAFRSRALLVGVVIAGLGLTALTAPAIAGAVAGDDDPATCTLEEYNELEAAGDNFALKCLLPGQELAGLRGLQIDGEDGVVKSDNMSIVADVPLEGAFAEAGAYGTDLAFKKNYAFVGNYFGFAIYDIKNPTAPKRIAQVTCPGSQNDISVYKNLMILSVDSSRSDNTCKSTAQAASEKSSWEGIRVFDIRDPKKPKYIASVETDCGSHTHTIAPSLRGKALYVYVSSYSPNADYPDCQPPHDFISVVKVPLRKPTKSRVVAKPVLFPGGGESSTSGCHDVTAYPAKNIMAGACMGDGLLMSIKNRTKPVILDQVTDANFNFWHSATFNNAGTKVVFTDELGGGSAPTCVPGLDNRGADGIYDVEANQLVFKSYYKMPRAQSLTENCVAHNGSLIPVKGKDIMVQAWYQGGIEVMDFTDSANPVQIAYYDRPALSQTELVLGGVWSSYWYNGYIYASDITRGFNVFRLDDPLTDPAKSVKLKRLNVQSQPGY